MNSVPYILNILYTILFSFFLHCLHDFCINTDAGFLHESFPTKINILTAISSQRNHIVQFFYMYTAVFESPRSLDWPFLIKINYKHSTFTPLHFSCCFRRNNVCTAFPASVNFAMLTFLKLNQFCQAIFRKPLCTLQPEWEFIMPRCGPLMNNKGQTKTNGTEKTKDLGCIYIRFPNKCVFIFCKSWLRGGGLWGKGENGKSGSEGGKRIKRSAPFKSVYQLERVVFPLYEQIKKMKTPVWMREWEKNRKKKCLMQLPK